MFLPLCLFLCLCPLQVSCFQVLVREFKDLLTNMASQLPATEGGAEGMTARKRQLTSRQSVFEVRVPSYVEAKRLILAAVAQR